MFFQRVARAAGNPYALGWLVVLALSTSASFSALNPDVMDYVLGGRTDEVQFLVSYGDYVLTLHFCLMLRWFYVWGCSPQVNGH